MSMFTDFLHRNPEATMYFNKIDLGNGYFMSVQASEFHYSTPRRLLASVEGYDAFEVGICNVNGLIQDPQEIKNLGLFEIVDEEEFEGVFPYISRDLVQKMFCHMKTL